MNVRHSPAYPSPSASVIEAPAGAEAARPADAGAPPGARAASVAAIVVTWNRRDAVAHVLRAIAAQDHPLDRLDVVVVDNASTDGTAEHLAREFHPERVLDNPTAAAHEPDFSPAAPPPPGEASPGGAARLNGRAGPAAGGRRNTLGLRSLTVVRNAHNHGGCGGFNTGFAFVERFLDEPGRGADRPDYVWLVDDDVDLPPDALRRLASTAEADPTIGIVGSRAVDFHDRQTTIETTIYFDFERGRMNDTPLPSHPLRAGHDSWAGAVGGTKGRHAFTGVRDVDVASACSLLARWSAVRRVGYWDYRYFIYCDDADWCLRFARAGYRVVCNLDAVVYHTPWFHKLTPARLYYSQRNVVWVIQKVFPRRRLKYATFRWLSSIMYDCLMASVHRRLFHAEIIRRTAHDVVTNRGGKLDNEGPPKSDAAAALDACGALRPGRSVAALCTREGSLDWSAELRAHVAAYLSERGRTADMPRWFDVVRNTVPGAEESGVRGQESGGRGQGAGVRGQGSRVRSQESGVRGQESAPGGGRSAGAVRIVFAPRLRSRLRRQLPLILRPPRAVVVFDQTNDMPLLRGRFNVHIDRKWPTTAQVERDGPGPRLAFWRRWMATGLRAVLYSLRVEPYRSPNRYG